MAYHVLFRHGFVFTKREQKRLLEIYAKLYVVNNISHLTPRYLGGW